jgi:type II secretory pathway component GspD/PulD (secretin)
MHRGAIFGVAVASFAGDMFAGVWVWFTSVPWMAMDLFRRLEMHMTRINGRSARTMLTFAAAFGGIVAMSPSAVLAQSAGTTEPVAPAMSTTTEALNRADSLISQGQVIRGRAILAGLTESGRAAALTDDDRTKALALVGTANAKIAVMDPLELSIQKAELAVDEADLRTAYRHASKVLQSSLLTDSQRERAQKVAAGVKAGRSQIEPKVATMVSQARADLEAGRYGDSKIVLESILRSGVELSPSLATVVDECRTQIVMTEQRMGTIFTAGQTAMGMVAQPETQPEAQPEAQPTEVQPADPIADAQRQAATNLLVQADKAFDSGIFNEADTRYNQLLAGYREYLTGEQVSHVERRITEARLKLNVTAGDPLNQVNESRGLVKQQTMAEFNNQLAQATSALKTGDVARARQFAAAARLTLNSGRDYFSDAEFETLNKQVTDSFGSIESETQRLSQAEAESRSKRLAEQATTAEQSRQRDRENKIREHLLRARELQREQKYRESIQVVDQILFLDEHNPAGLILRDILEDAYLVHEYENIRDAQKSEFAKHVLDNERAIVTPTGIVNFAKDWPAISSLRGEPLQFAETAEDRRVRTVLETKRIPADFRDNSFGDVVNFIRTVSNLDVDIDWQSLDSVGITQDATVTLQLKNVTLRSVLDRVIDQVSASGSNRAGWEISDGVLRIASDEMLRRNVTTLVYDIRDLLLEVPDYNDAPEFDLQSVLQNSGSGGGGGSQSPFRDTGGGNQNQNQNRRTLEERTDDLLQIVQENIDPEGWIDGGGTTGRVNSLNGNLIITNTPKNHQAIESLLRKLREVRAMQINVESRFLLVNTEFFEQIGFDIDVYFNANNNQVRVARGNDPTVQASDFFSRETGNLNRNVTGAQADTDGDGEVDTFVTQGVVNPRSWSPIGVTQNSSSLSSALIPNEGFVQDIRSGSSAPALGIAGQFLDDIQVDFLIQATQADRRSVRLTAPRLTFTNGQISNIYVATQTAFVSDLQPIVSDSAVGFDPELSTLNEGVVMLLEGTISSDRRYVTLNVDVAVSKLEGFQNRSVTAVAGGQLVNSADTQSFIQAPTSTVTRVQTTVTVPDQGTILIGGQRLINEVEAESGVPVLSKIPILNRFFSNRVQVKEEQTLIVLIKPTILIQNEQEERNFPGLADTLRTGLGG